MAENLEGDLREEKHIRAGVSKNRKYDELREAALAASSLNRFLAVTEHDLSVRRRVLQIHHSIKIESNEGWPKENMT